MTNELLASLPLLRESVAKMTSEGGMLIADNISLYGFFTFCLLFVGFCLIVPAHLYEKYYKVGDDEDTVDPVAVETQQQTTTKPAA